MNRLSAGTTPNGGIDVSYMVEGADVLEINIEKTIDFWVSEHNGHCDIPLEKWEIKEAEAALWTIVFDYTSSEF